MLSCNNSGGIIHPIVESVHVTSDNLKKKIDVYNIKCIVCLDQKNTFEILSLHIVSWYVTQTGSIFLSLEKNYTEQQPYNDS